MLSFGEGQNGLILIGFGRLPCRHLHWARILRDIGCRGSVAAELLNRFKQSLDARMQEFMRQVGLLNLL